MSYSVAHPYTLPHIESTAGGKCLFCKGFLVPAQISLKLVRRVPCAPMD